MNKRSNSRHWWQEDANIKVDLLREKINEVINSLNTRQRKNIPWFLVIGEEDAGKTSLLSQSSFTLTSVDGKPFTHMGPTLYCDWWLSDQAVFIDTSGSLIMPKNPTNDAHFIWNKFIDLLHQRRRGRPVDGVMLCVDLCDFQSKNYKEQQRQIDVFRHRIQTLRKYKHAIPIYLIFTKCDHIAGFLPSYHMLTPEDRNEMFGFSLSNTLRLQEAFDGLLRQINQTLLTHLHHEHHPDRRWLIKNFPLQIESQRRNIMLLANQLHSQKTTLNMVCFTSAQQDGKTYDILKAQSHHFGLPIPSEQENFQTSQPQKPFFIQRAFEYMTQESLTNRPHTISRLTQHRTRLYTVLASTIVMFGMFMLYNYYQVSDTLNEVQLALEKSPQKNKENPEALVSELFMLKKSMQALDQRKYFIPQMIFKQNRQLNEAVQHTYQDILQSQFSALVQDLFEKKLGNINSNNNTLNTQALFETLKAYAMLKNPAHMDHVFLSSWFSQQWKSMYPATPAKQQALMAALRDWIRLNPTNFKINETLLTSAQKKLNNTSLSTLAYLHIQDKYEVGETKAVVGKFFSINLPNQNSLYAPENFNSIYRHTIPKVAQEMMNQGDWMMQLDLPQNLRKPIIEQLVQDLRKLYTQNYAIFWQTQLFNATLNPFPNIEQATTFAAAFSGDHSPIVQLLELIETKLTPLQNLPEGKEPLKVQHQIHAALANALSDENIRNTVQTLHQYLYQLNTAPDKGQATLQATQQRMRAYKDSKDKKDKNDAITNMFRQAQSTPAPLKDWLQTLAANTWSTMLKTSQRQLNLIWMTEILPVYNETVKDRYPIFSDAKNDISLEAFAAFFGPDGILDNFFNREIAVFANTQKLYWTWEKVDNHQLSIPQETLNAMNMASLIKQMFFSAPNPTTLQLKFSLMPMPNTLKNTSSNYVLNLGHEIIDYLRDVHLLKSLTWPVAQSMPFELRKHPENKIMAEATGDWALFRLLSQARVGSDQNTRHFDIVFNADGVSVPYKLISDQPINPFIPNLLTSFRCPKDLMQAPTT